MEYMTLPKTYDTVNVGACISGAILAQDLTNEGQRILLLEKGSYHRFLRNHPTLVRIADKKGFRYKKEHLFVASGITVGGSSVLLGLGLLSVPQKDFFALGESILNKNLMKWKKR